MTRDVGRPPASQGRATGLRPQPPTASSRSSVPDAEALLPCPFCDSSELEEGSSDITGLVWWHVICRRCGANVEAAIKGEHIARWNTRPSPWQPIETAPKDGTTILLFERLPTGDYYHIGYWTESGEDIHSDERRAGWTEEGDGYVGCIEPTHWMALTAPASVDTLPKGQDSEAGLVRSKGSAVGGEADETPKTQRIQSHD